MLYLWFVFLAPLNLVLDFLFIDVLSAPSPDIMKAQLAESSIQRAIRRVSNAARRASAASVRVIQSVRDKTTSRQSARKTFKVDTTRVVPDTTTDAQVLAVTSLGDILKQTRSELDTQETERRQKRNQSHVSKTHDRLEMRAHRYTMMADGAHAHVAPSRRDVDAATSAVVTDRKLAEAFSELIVDMTEQRKALKRWQQEAFDAMWG
jgi:hypothetical protein